MTVFASFLFSHLHVSIAADVCPPPGAALPPMRWSLGAGLRFVEGSVLMAVAARRLRSARLESQRGLRLLVVLALLCTTGALPAAVGGHARAGLDPTSTAWSATVGVLLGYGLFHGVLLALMGGDTMVRSWSGHLQPEARATLDNTVLMWHCVTAQRLIGLVVVQAMPILTQGARRQTPARSR